MDVLLCYPTPLQWGRTQYFDEAFAQLALQQTGCQGLRVNLDRRGDFRPWERIDVPFVGILDLDDYDVWAHRYAIADYAEEVVYAAGDRLLALEVGNEPYTMHKMPPSRYQAIAWDVWIRCAHKVPIWLAGDIVRPGGIFHEDWVNWGRVALANLPRHAVAVHPYWETYLPCAHSLRQKAWDELRTQLGDNLVVTEFGYKSGMPLAYSAVWDDLCFFRDHQVPTVCYYAHHGEFGVLDDDRQLTAMGRALRDWHDQDTHAPTVHPVQ